MTSLLVLARGDGRAFIDLQGQSVLKDFPTPVVVFSDKANAKYFRDLGEQVSVEVVRWSDRQEIARVARRWRDEQGVSAVATLDEKTIELAAELRAELGLQGMGPEQALRFRNKVVMKQMLARSGVRVPRFAQCSDRAAVEQLLTEHRRLVIKPESGQGSREVAFVSSKKELDQWYHRTLRHFSSFEAEEHIDGVLYHVNAVVRSGRPILTACAPYLPGMSNIDFAAGAPFVSVLLTEGELADRLEEFSSRALAALGLHEGVTHMECFVTPAGEIVFCETAVRPGGGGIVLMIEGQYGVNLSRAALLLEAGRGDLIDAGRADPGVLGLIGFRQAFSGLVKSAPAPEAFSESWIRHVRVDCKPGAFVAPASHCTDFLGLLVFSSANRAEFDVRRAELDRRFHSSLVIEPQH